MLRVEFNLRTMLFLILLQIWFVSIVTGFNSFSTICLQLVHSPPAPSAETENIRSAVELMKHLISIRIRAAQHQRSRLEL